MAERTLRGARLGGQSFEDERGIEFAARQQCGYRCVNGHEFEVTMSIEAEVPADKIIHAVLDNYAPHKHPKSLPRRRPGSAAGSRGIPAGCSTSRPSLNPGSTPSRASFRSEVQILDRLAPDKPSSKTA